jgi:hypothetical protein
MSAAEIFEQHMDLYVIEGLQLDTPADRGKIMTVIVEDVWATCNYSSVISLIMVLAIKGVTAL